MMNLYKFVDRYMKLRRNVEESAFLFCIIFCGALLCFNVSSVSSRSDSMGNGSCHSNIFIDDGRRYDR